MSTALLALAALTLLAWLAFGLDGALGRRHLLFLERVPDPDEATLAALPSLSVIVPARNEQETLEPALRSLLASRYGELEIIVVDDRSEDATGEIARRVAAEDPRLQVLRIESLPEGWLGKPHALHRGAEIATGQLLLFTDADVLFDPRALGRGAWHLQRQGLDHLTVGADIVTPGPGVELFVATFVLMFNGFFRPWRAMDPNSDVHVGLGTFNLVRASLYNELGGHRSIAREPLDDILLGRLLKRGGGRQQCGLAGSLLRVEWYPSLGAAIRGLEKNSLAAVGWSPLLLLGGAAGQVLFTAWPYAAIWLTSGLTSWLNVGIVACIVVIHSAMLRETSLRPWTTLALPLGVLLVAWTYVRALVLTYWRGGIVWRGTFYRLSDLR